MLNELAHQIHRNAVEKGFYDNPLPVPTLLMLVVSELGEAVEADRTGKRADLKHFNFLLEQYPNKFTNVFENNIKNTMEDELADTIIRLLDICAAMKIDIDEHIRLKMRYNSGRAHKHGKNY